MKAALQNSTSEKVFNYDTITELIFNHTNLSKQILCSAPGNNYVSHIINQMAENIFAAVKFGAILVIQYAGLI